MHTELYDLDEDPSETLNLSDAYPLKRDELKKMLHDWRESISAKIPQRNPQWTNQ